MPGPQVYSLSGAGQITSWPFPVQSQRNPITGNPPYNDVVSPDGYPYNLGQLWINTVTSDIFIYLGGGNWVTDASGQIEVTNISGNYTVVPSDYYVGVDTSSAPITVTLPANPLTGQTVYIVDSTGHAGTNNITISGNGENINGASTSTISTNYGALSLVFNGTQWTSGAINISSPVGVAQGGTGDVTLTANALLIGKTAAPIATVGPGLTGQTVMGSTANAPAFTSSPSFGGSVTIATGLTVTAGGITSSGTTAINGGGNTVTLGADSTSNGITIGNLSGSTGVIINVGTNNFLLQGVAASTMTIGQASQTGTITIGNSTAGNEIDIGIGVNTGAQLITIGNGASGANTEVDILSGVGTAGVGTLKMGNNTRITTINLGNVAPAAARTTTIAGGNSAQNDTVTILGGAPTANTQTFNVLSGNNAGGTQVLNLATGTGGKTVHLADGGGVNTVTIGSSNTSSTTTIQAGTGSLSLLSGQVVSINSSVNSGASPYTVVGTDFFIGCDPTAGPITVTLPVAPATGRHVIVVDATGQAAANNITISGNGKNISSGGTSAASKVLSTAYSSLNIYYNGTIWNAA